MPREKKNELQEDYNQYSRALKDKKVPLLVLDQKWHELFHEHAKTSEIKSLERKLNRLVKKQGKANTDIVEFRKAKKVLMKTIVNNMDDGMKMDSEEKFLKKDKSQKMILEINDKIEQAKQLLEEIPIEIKEVNEELMIECMKVCYERLITNTQQIEHLEKWIMQTRDELKDNILLKQDLEGNNTAMYTYMHDLLGAEVMEIFDKDKEVWKGESS